MSPNEFAYWLQGLAELNDAPPTSEQWAAIKDHLAQGHVHMLNPLPTPSPIVPAMTENETGPAAVERAAIVAWLRDIIEQGYPSFTDIGGTHCVHGTPIEHDCIGCYDDHLHAALDHVLAGDHIPTGDER